MNRNKRVATAYETLDILEKGFYVDRNNQKVEIAIDLKTSIDGTIHYKTGDFEKVFIERDRLLATGMTNNCRISVTDETTFAAARRLVVKEEKKNVCCLNFASAKNPGGGFLGGAQAQEEALSRASGLYPSLKAKQEMYDSNRALGTCLYSDQMIYSPNVPVFRNDRDELLDEPYCVAILTSPAVNRGALQSNEPEKLGMIAPTMLSRIEKLLSLALIHGQTTLVLGAWGCGVFRQDPTEVAEWFAQHLLKNPIFKGAFEEIVFAIYDSSEKQVNKNAFKTVYEAYGVQ
ncbi:TIGR02452 family protein [Chitinophaga silvatica]|uniref:TIGR02452 family protein n=1 Tax=Chitinophaga silvatica TaxID=2282649 RepID=A0A3E1Y2L4_9BACT|nr:TIGR02452 family protein [Chitinophaga silvatica]RFS18901.1 TIGR02452 family protein [Chitinophaga silvatica]